MWLTWHSVDRKPGFGIEVQSDDGGWTIRWVPPRAEPGREQAARFDCLWVLLRNIDTGREFTRLPSLDGCMDAAQEIVDQEALDHRRDMATRRF